MKYSIDESTLSALGEATRRFTDEFRLENNEYTSKAYKLDSDAHNSSANPLLIPICGATSVVITKIACDPEDIITRICLHNCYTPDWVSYTDTGKSQFTAQSFLSMAWAFGLYCPEPGIIYDFEVTWLDANGEPMTVTIEEEVFNTLTPGQMVEVLNNYDLSRMIPDSALTITGSCSYKFAYGTWDWFLNQMGNKITTYDISSTDYMFAWSTGITRVPFTINMKPSKNALNHMFITTNKLMEVPMILGVQPEKLDNMFSGCNNLRNFPGGFAEDWDWSYLDNSTSGYTGSMNNMFYNCYKLRTIPQVLLSHGNPYWTYTYALTNRSFYGCHSLESLTDVFIPYKASLKGSYANAFSDVVTNCSHLKRFTLMTDNDSNPYEVAWSNQTIDLTTVGYFKSTSDVTNAGFKDTTKITDEGTWYEYFNSINPNRWTNDVAYSVFGASAAKELFATLPNTSGTSCAVKLNSNATSAIPGEAMSSLTEEDIAVATAKGWTITFV